MEYLTAADVAAEDWAAHEEYPKQHVECRSDPSHHFMSHYKFSGRLVALVSREPCPACGNHSLYAARGCWERQEIKDTGNAENS